MPEQDSTSRGGYAGVLGQIVGGLKSQPALLFGLGGGIVLLGLSAAVGGEAWMLVVGIVLVLLAALGAWFLGARAQARANAGTDKIGAGEMEISKKSTGITRGGEGRAEIDVEGKLIVTDRSHGIIEREESGSPPSDSKA